MPTQPGYKSHEGIAGKGHVNGFVDIDNPWSLREESINVSPKAIPLNWLLLRLKEVSDTESTSKTTVPESALLLRCKEVSDAGRYRRSTLPEN